MHRTGRGRPMHGHAAATPVTDASAPSRRIRRPTAPDAERSRWPARADRPRCQRARSTAPRALRRGLGRRAATRGRLCLHRPGPDLVEAGAAVDRAIVPWRERHDGLPPAGSAHRGMELARPLPRSGPLGRSPARRAALRIVGQALARIEGLFAGGEDELLRAIPARQTFGPGTPSPDLQLGSDAMTVEPRTARRSDRFPSVTERGRARVGPGADPGLLAEKIRAASRGFRSCFEAVPSDGAANLAPGGRDGPVCRSPTRNLCTSGGVRRAMSHHRRRCAPARLRPGRRGRRLLRRRRVRRPVDGASGDPSVESQRQPGRAATIGHPTGATDVILRYDEGGGFVMPAFAAAHASRRSRCTATARSSSATRPSRRRRRRARSSS